MAQTLDSQPAAGAAPRPSRIAAMFARCKAEGRTAILPYLTVGYPDVETTLAAIPAMVEAGADAFELGMAFSDPLADGPTIQRTNQRALEQGVTTETTLAVARQLRAGGLEAPLIAMGYFNPILRYGVAEFVVACAEAGIDGLIVPDLPPEESDEIVAACKRHGRDFIMFISPTSPERRIREVARRTSGFIYCISLTGVTGARAQMSEGLGEYLARVRQQTDLPLAVGFGISKAEHVAQVGQSAEGALIGAAVLNALAAVEDRPLPERVAAVADFVRGLRG